MHVFEFWQHYRCTLGLPCFLGNMLQLEQSWHKIPSGQVHRYVLWVSTWVQWAASRATKVRYLQKLKFTIQGLRVKGQTPLEGRRSLTPSSLQWRFNLTLNSTFWVLLSSNATRQFLGLLFPAFLAIRFPLPSCTPQVSGWFMHTWLLLSSLWSPPFLSPGAPAYALGSG